MSHDSTGIEDLLFATLDVVSRYKVGQHDAVSAALEAGPLLTKAKGRVEHGQWADWLDRVGLAPRTARTWMKLASMDLTAEEVIERGGINAAAQGRGKTASKAVLPDTGLDRDLVEAEAEIADTKQAYYDALSRRNRALRALAREGGDE